MRTEEATGILGAVFRFTRLDNVTMSNGKPYLTGDAGVIIHINQAAVRRFSSEQIIAAFESIEIYAEASRFLGDAPLVTVLQIPKRSNQKTAFVLVKLTENLEKRSRALRGVALGNVKAKEVAFTINRQAENDQPGATWKAAKVGGSKALGTTPARALRIATA